MLFRNHSVRPRTAFAVLAAAFIATGALTACRSLPPSKPESQWTAEEARGAQVYGEKCARCHYPTSTRGLQGPGLQAITKVKAMPSARRPPMSD